MGARVCRREQVRAVGEHRRAGDRPQSEVTGASCAYNGAELATPTATQTRDHVLQVQRRRGRGKKVGLWQRELLRTEAGVRFSQELAALQPPWWQPRTPMARRRGPVQR